ncbi:MAG: hypothetical protein ACFFG0_03805 [Candidatus Thorarchaeota archaeon]
MEAIRAIEMLSAPVLFYLYFILAISVTLIFRFLFKKNAAMYITFLSTFIIFLSFSKEFISTLPFDIMDVPKIVCKFSGALLGVFLTELWKRQQKTKRRKLV